MVAVGGIASFVLCDDRVEVWGSGGQGKYLFCQEGPVFLMYFCACNSTVWVKISWVKIMPQCSKRWVMSPAYSNFSGPPPRPCLKCMGFHTLPSGGANLRGGVTMLTTIPDDQH